MINKIKNKRNFPDYSGKPLFKDIINSSFITVISFYADKSD